MPTITIDLERLSREIRHQIAREELTPKEVLTILSQDKDAEIRADVARNHLTPPEVLSSLSEDAHIHVRIAVAENISTPKNILTKLYENEPSYYDRRYYENENIRNIYLMKALAKNIFTPEETLIKLFDSEKTEISVLISLAQNISTPLKILSQLSKNTNKEIKSYIAGNISASSEILTFLFEEEKNDDVIICLAANTSTPTEILRKFISRFYGDHQYHSFYRKKTYQLLAQNKSVPLDLLIFLSKQGYADADKTLHENYKYVKR